MTLGVILDLGVRIFTTHCMEYEERGVHPVKNLCNGNQ